MSKKNRFVCLGQRAGLARDDEGDRHLPLDRVGDRDHCDIDDAGMLHQHVLDLLGIDSLAGAANAVVDAPDDLDVALIVGADDASRVRNQPLGSSRSAVISGRLW